MAYKEWSSKERDALIKYYGKISAEEIGKVLGRSKYSVIHAAKRFGIERTKYHQQYSIDLNRIITLVSQGKTGHQIADALGVSKGCINARIRKMPEWVRYRHLMNGKKAAGKAAGEVHKAAAAKRKEVA
jgi:biotin operon repressor